MNATSRSGRKRIVLLGWYGSDNIGDEAVLQAVIEALTKRGGDNLIALSIAPAKTTSRLGIASAPRNPFNLDTLRALRGANALVLGGGGLIQDGTSLYNLLLYTVYVALARLFGLKVICWGLGVEPLNTLFGKLQTRFIVRAAHHFSVRDGMSRQLLARAGVPPGSVKIAADPAFLIRPEPIAPSRAAKKAGAPTVVFCLRHLSDNHPGLNMHYLLPVSVRKRLGIGWKPPSEHSRRLVRAIGHAIYVCALEFGAHVELLPLWPGRDDSILDEAERAAIELGAPPYSISRADVEHTPGAIAAYIGKADLLVSMRLHALIFAASQGVPMLALSYARKMRGLMRLLDAERWVVEVQTRNSSPEELEMKLRLLWQMRGQESFNLRRTAELSKQKAEEDADEIATTLGKGP